MSFIARVARPVSRAAAMRPAVRFYSAGGDESLAPAEFDSKWKVRAFFFWIVFFLLLFLRFGGIICRALSSKSGLHPHPQAYFEDVSLTSKDVRRGLNDVFAHDVIPATDILVAAFRATRRLHDFPTCVAVDQLLGMNRGSNDRDGRRSVRIFEGIKDKSQSEETYKYVLAQLAPVMTELGLTTPEDLNL